MIINIRPEYLYESTLITQKLSSNVTQQFSYCFDYEQNNKHNFHAKIKNIIIFPSYIYSYTFHTNETLNFYTDNNELKEEIIKYVNLIRKRN